MEGVTRRLTALAVVEHTWEAEGPLGVKLRPVGNTADSRDGVYVNLVNAEELIRVIPVDTFVEEVAGESVAGLTYTEILDKIKKGGRPLTIKFVSAEEKKRLAQQRVEGGATEEPSSPEQHGIELQHAESEAAAEES